MKRPFSIIYVFLAALIGFIVWASFFQIDETVRARGKVVVQGRVQVVQSPEGGVLRALNVQEGDRVTAGQIVAVMDGQAQRAAVDEVIAEIETNEIARLRASAELTGDVPNFGELGVRYPKVAAAQLALFEGNGAALAAELDIAQRQLTIAQEQLASIAALAQNGDVSKAEVARAQREALQAEGQVSATQEKYRAQARKDIAAIEQEISTLEFRLAARKTSLGYAELTAPQDGIVTQLKTETIGAVLRGGDELMRISPSEGDLVAEVQFAPISVGSLAIGQPVTAQLDSFPSTVYGGLEATLAYVSADTISETGPDGRAQTFYKGRVEFSQSQMNDRIDLASIKPGMELSVDVKTGRRSIMTYLAKPIVRAFAGAFSEK